ncbi:MAG TPA: kelch repeat-containing protein [Planctomycetota bacterium]|nr:kelch repeat-containing protein [Planctomycetota bacterium]
MAEKVAVKPGAEELAASLLLYAVEMTGDPLAAEDLLAESTSRVFRWSEPDDLPASREPLFRAVTAQAHGPLNRLGRPPLPAVLRSTPDRFDEGIEAALAALAGRERAALFLVVVERLSYERAAAVLGTTVANTANLVWRARRALRARLVGSLPVTDITDSLDSPVPSTEQRISKVLRAGCARAGLFISGLIDGALSPRQREVLDPHMAACGVCSEERARFEQVTAAVRTHWVGLAARLTAAGLTRRALGTVSLGRKARARGPSARRMQLGAVAASLAGIVLLAVLFALLGRGSRDAVATVEGPAERSSGVIRAKGPVTVGFLDGTQARLEAGSSISAVRGSGTNRPKIRLLAGSAELAVSHGPSDLVVESAAGSCRSGMGNLSVRLAARSAQGRPLTIELGRARALAPGERLALVAEAHTSPLTLSGQVGKDLEVPPGGAGIVPVSDAPRPLAVPGRWVGLQASGSGEPSERAGAAFGCDRGSGQMALFGGMASEGTPGNGEMNDLWSYDPALGGWQEIAVSSDAAKWLQDQAPRRQAERPAPQLPGALVGDPKDRGVWLYSGRLGGNPLPDLWFLEIPGSWQKAADYVPAQEPRPAGGARGGRPPAGAAAVPPRPAPVGRSRAALAASAAAGGIILFGGDLDGRIQGDTWLFDVTASVWKPYPLARGPGPEPRTAAAMAADGGGKRIWLFGGRSQAGAPLGDLWCLDVSGPQGGVWQAVTPRGVGPGPRTGAVMACEEDSGSMVLFGGRPRLGGPLAETWVLRTEVSGPGRWSSLTGAGGPAPDDFGAPAMAWHPQCRILVLYARGSLWSLRLGK